MSPIRVLLADLDAATRQTFAGVIAGRGDTALMQDRASGASIAAAIRGALPDIVVLGIGPTPVDMLAILREFVPAARPAFVVVGARPEDAVRTFATQAIDFLLRPLDTSRCADTLDKAKRHLCRIDALALSVKVSELLLAGADRSAVFGAERYTDRLTVSRGGRAIVLQTRQVDWLAADGSYTRVHSGESHFLVRRTIASLEARLDPRLFIRTHRSAVVNVDRVVEIRRGADSRMSLVLTSGAVVPVSKRRRDAVELRFGAPR